MNIAIVNDEPSTNQLLEQLISRYSRHNVLWTAEDGAIAIEKSRQNTPDVILMDLIMPNMDGIEATREIMNSSPCAILLVTACVDNNADMIFRAMAYGALDVITTPTLNRKSSLDHFFSKLAIIEKLIRTTSDSIPCGNLSHLFGRKRTPMVCIGSSTGGPGALSTILSAIPYDSEAAYVIVQHVDSHFISGLAEWLNSQCKPDVTVARKGDEPLAGNIYVAGGDKHITINKNNKFEYTPHPLDYAYRPSIDIFFNSVVKNWGGKIIGILLTGMGKDGANGLLSIKNKGEMTIAQNKETCAVFGMPRAAITIKAARLVLPVENISAAIEKELNSFSCLKSVTSADRL